MARQVAPALRWGRERRLYGRVPPQPRCQAPACLLGAAGAPGLHACHRAAGCAGRCWLASSPGAACVWSLVAARTPQRPPPHSLPSAAPPQVAGALPAAAPAPTGVDSPLVDAPAALAGVFWSGPLLPVPQRMVPAEPFRHNPCGALVGGRQAGHGMPWCGVEWGGVGRGRNEAGCGTVVWLLVAACGS